MVNPSLGGWMVSLRTRCNNTPARLVQEGDWSALDSRVHNAFVNNNQTIPNYCSNHFTISSYIPCLFLCAIRDAYLATCNLPFDTTQPATSAEAASPRQASLSTHPHRSTRCQAAPKARLRTRMRPARKIPSCFFLALLKISDRKVLLTHRPDRRF